MRALEFLATVAVAGAVATFAVMNLNSVENGQAFLATPITDSERAFINFIAKYRRSYGTKEEYAYRLELFSKVYEQIQAHDAEASGYELGINHLSDMSPYEYQQMLGYVAQPGDKNYVSEINNLRAATVDWRDKGAVTPVKDQGSCGSCWAFSSTGSLEGAYFNAKGSLLSFSEQQLVDCAKGIKYLDFGCNGGMMDNAFKYWEDYGAMLESDYPYKAKDGDCAYNAALGKVNTNSYVDVTPKSADDLETAINKGPVSVAIQANQIVFQSYKGGIIADDGKCGTNLDHGVLAVGYGNENGTQYFIIKNSWGSSWGESGYVRLAYNGNTKVGACGVLMEPSYPVL
jgi:C1A family cysteine protease